MNKQIISVVNNISSAHPSIVTRIINPSGKLELKTSAVVIDTNKDEIHVYRHSTMAKGKWSLDIYDTSTKKLIRKDKDKYDVPPLAPDGAHEHIVKGVTFWTMTERTECQLTELAKRINL